MQKKKRGKKQIDDFRSKLGFKLHDITMNKGESVTTKKAKSIFKLKQTTTTICLKLSNWFIFAKVQISNRSWWKRTHWQRKKKRK